MNDADLQTVLDTLASSLRHPIVSEPLTQGQSRAQVYRLRYSWGTAILKGPLQPREEAFYHEVAPRLETIDLAVPTVFGWGKLDNEAWLVREDLPIILPHNRWVADEEILTILRQIHRLPLSFPIPQPFVPQWEPMPLWLQQRMPPTAQASIDQLKACYDRSCTPQCVIGGDPNPSNWGLRQDGKVVLFDWDRIGYGTPAFDLAITVPGMGWPTIFAQVAEAYLAEDMEHRPDQIARLVHDMAISKAQVSLAYAAAPEIAEESRHIICGLLPSWLVMIGEMDSQYHEDHAI